MAGQEFTLVIEVKATVNDSTWTEQDLLVNAAMYFQYIVDHAERNRAGGDPYDVDVSDLTVWTKDGYAADLAEGKP